MRILVVCGAGYVSGLEIVTLNLIQGLRQRGHDVRCITSSWGDGDLPRRLEASSIPHIRLPLGFISKTLSLPALIMSLDQLIKLPKLWVGYLRYVRNFEPHVILHSNFHHLILLWPFLAVGNCLYHVHNCFPPTTFYRFLFKALNKRLGKFIAVSDFAGRSLLNLKLPPHKVVHVPNGVAFDHEPEGKTVKPKASDVQPSTYSPVRIGIVGQIGGWKGHDDLIEALRLLKDKCEQFSCLIFGRGEPSYVEKLKYKAGEYGLHEQICFVGFVERIEDIFPRVDVCVAPSRYEEPFGMVAAEAAFFGIPVIATRKGGLPEVVTNGVTGFLVNAESPIEIAEKLFLLVKNPDLRQQLGQAALDRARSCFTQEKMVRDMESIFIRTRRAGEAANGI